MGEATRTGCARHAARGRIALVALDVRLVGTAHYANATPCLWCSQDARARAEYVATYAPLRAVAAKLNRELPEARIGFMILNARRLQATSASRARPTGTTIRSSTACGSPRRPTTSKHSCAHH